MASDITGVYLRWITLRALLSRGYWLVASLYLVVDAGLSPFQLVFLGTAQSAVAFLTEAPAGVLADTISRKWSLVVAHVLVGGGMLLTGLVTGFWLLVIAQIIWGVGWTFSSGADVAWITDELDDPERIGAVLAAGARWGLLGAIAGLGGIGLLSVVTWRATAMVASGVAMAALGLYVALRFPERGFARAPDRHWQRSMAILRNGVALARHDRVVLVIIIATVLVNGGAEAFGRLYPRHLVDLGFPGRLDPIVWLTALSVLSYAFGALAMRIVETRVHRRGAARRSYALACILGAAGLVVLAAAPGFALASVGILIVSGVALTVSRSVGVIWVNRRSTSDVRATVQSMLAQAEYVGEIACGVLLGALAQATSIGVAFVCSGAILAYAAALTFRLRQGD